ncbi:AEC family transporter [Sinomonas sp. ASV322]|uniref:AEC family transporter n=1 Tax=Sinomonas sp. ASV322 TaxID=3041920 RepID=UPI0027DD52C8|nr:AEC family transporter [Sinomonas sp. ASV322]MDQ4502609.1 AEC family transporter [Sinomonas sp. ASV322]
MLGVLAGFFVVWAIIGAGWFVARKRLLGDGAQAVLSRLSFFVASPALLLETLSKADLHTIFSTHLLVIAVSSTVVGLVSLAVFRWVRRRELPEALIASMSSSVANSANLGIPISVFVLGNASYVAPLLIFQLALFTPSYLLLLDGTTATAKPGAARALQFVLPVVTNPNIIGSLIGLVLAATGWRLPDLIMQPIHLIGGAAIPAMLMAFGISLHGSRPLRADDGRRLDTVFATALKLVIHPLIAFAFARFALGLGGHALFAAVVTAALPTAQNVYVAAQRYQVGLVVAKDTVLITTVVAIPAMAVMAALLS